MNTTTQDQTQAVAADGQTPKVQNAPKRFKKQAGNVLITTIIGIIITAILAAGAVMGLNATIVTNKRSIKADDYFLGLYETALERDEIITFVRETGRGIMKGYTRRQNEDLS